MKHPVKTNFPQNTKDISNLEDVTRRELPISLALAVFVKRIRHNCDGFAPTAE